MIKEARFSAEKLIDRIEALEKETANLKLGQLFSAVQKAGKMAAFAKLDKELAAYSGDARFF